MDLGYQIMSSYLDEVEKVAEAGPEEVVTALGLGSAGAGAGLKKLEGSAKVQELDAPKKVVIYYTDPRRGAGHEFQGKAVAAKLEAALGKGNVELVNFDKEFGNRKILESYNKSFNAFRSDPAKSQAKKLPYVINYVRFYRSVDAEKVRKAMNVKGVQPVFANPQLAWVAQRAGVPHGISMQTDQAPWKSMDPETGIFGTRQGRHIVSESAKDEFFAQHKTLKSRTVVVPDLAISDPPDPKAKMIDKITGKQIKMDGKYNITVSGGAQGWDTDKITRNLLKAELPEGTVIHVVTGGDKQPDGKILNTEVFKRATAVRGRPGVEVRVYGWSPLRQMMGKADLNVLRPHGTSITEATAAARPYVMAIPDSPLDMELNDAHAASKHTKQPAVRMDKIPDAVNDVMSNYQQYHSDVGKKARGARTAAQHWADAITGPGLLRKYRFAGRGTQGVAKALLALSIPTALVGVAGLHEKKVTGKSGGHWRKLRIGQKGRGKAGERQVGRTWVKRAADERKGIRIGMGIVSTGLLALGVAAARRGRTLRSLEGQVPKVVTKSSKEFLDLLKPGDLILTQIKPGRKPNQKLTYKVIVKSQGEMAHSAMYLGDGKISHITPEGNWKGRVDLLGPKYLTGEKSALVIRPSGDLSKAVEIAKKRSGDYTFKLNQPQRIGAAEILPEGAANKLINRLDRGRVVCTTMIADLYARGGVKLPKHQSRMLCIDFRKMNQPPIMKFQGSSKELKTSPIQGAGFIIPGLTIGGVAAAPEIKKGIQKMSNVSKLAMQAFWEEIEKMASWAPSSEQIRQLAMMKGIESDSQLPGSAQSLLPIDKASLDKMTASERRRIYTALMLV
tara:strand:- start:781 stop:3312 length:2532 start_codon:yes stop_codon:yes gene_type:complete